MVTVDEQRASMVRLLTAETEFLRAMGWTPLVPVVTDGPVFWRSPSGFRNLRQDAALLLAKSEWVQRYER